MRLVLAVVGENAEPLGRDAKKVFGPEGGSLGRSGSCNWRLPDPSNTLSSRHAVIGHNGVGFTITDTSTNGVYINTVDAPLGRGNTAPLSDGDVLYLADYVISVSFEADAADERQRFGLGSDAIRVGGGAARWAEPKGDPRPPALPGTGAGLFGTEPPPVVDPLAAFGASPVGPSSAATARPPGARQTYADPLSVLDQERRQNEPSDTEDLLSGRPMPARSAPPLRRAGGAGQGWSGPPAASGWPDPGPTPPSSGTPALPPSAPLPPIPSDVGALAIGAPPGAAAAPPSQTTRGAIPDPFDFSDLLPGGAPAAPRPAPAPPLPAVAPAPRPPVSPSAPDFAATPATLALPDLDFSDLMPGGAAATPRPVLPASLPAAPVPPPSPSAAPAVPNLDFSDLLPGGGASKPASPPVTGMAAPLPNLDFSDLMPGGGGPKSRLTPPPASPPAPAADAASAPAAPQPPVPAPRRPLSPNLASDLVSLRDPAADAPMPGERVLDPLAVLRHRAAERVNNVTRRSTNTSLPLPPAMPSAGAGGDDLQAFWDALGIDPQLIPPEQRQEALAELGRALREMAEGLQSVLAARTMLKGEFRIEQTRIQSGDNNPFKFLKSGLDALRKGLLREHGFLPLSRSVRESFQDIKAHEVAAMVAMRAVIGNVLTRVSPPAIETEDVSTGMFGRRDKAKLWDRFVQLHATLVGDLDHTTRAFITEEFSRTYDDQVAKLRQGEGRTS